MAVVVSLSTGCADNKRVAAFREYVRENDLALTAQRDAFQRGLPLLDDQFSSPSTFDVRAVAITKDGEHVFVALFAQRKGYLIRTSTGEVTAVPYDFPSAWSVAFVGSRDQLVGVGRLYSNRQNDNRGGLFRFNLASGEARLLHTFTADDPIFSVEGSPTSDEFLATSTTGIQGFRLNGTKTQFIEGRLASFSPDGSELAYTDFKHRLHLLKEGHDRSFLQFSSHGCLAWSPDPRYLLLCESSFPSGHYVVDLSASPPISFKIGGAPIKGWEPELWVRNYRKSRSAVASLPAHLQSRTPSK
jgi:hypothetical protein